MSSTITKDTFTSQVTLKTDVVSESYLDNVKTIHLVLPTSAFLNTEIPNEANSRGFTGNKNQSVREMIKTLKTEPHLFHYKNLGIRIVSSECIRNDNSITLFFKEGEGIFNGGHTYEVLKTHGRDDAFVYVTVDLNVPAEKLTEISLALNMSKKLELISQGDKQGKFDWIKEALPLEPIIYKEGDTGEYRVSDVLKVANLLKTTKGKKYVLSSVSASIAYTAQIIKENNEKQTLIYTQDILPDLWELYKQVKTNEKIQKNLPPKYIRKGEIPRGLVLMILSGIRYMTEIDKEGKPQFKKGYNVKKALSVFEKMSSKIGKELRKPPFSEMKSDVAYRSRALVDQVLVMYSMELN